METRLKLLLLSAVTLYGTIFCMADEPDFYFGALGYSIVSASEQTCEVAVGKYNGEVVVPSEVTYSGKTFKVIGVGNSAFLDSKVKSIKLSEGIRYVREKGISLCISLKKLTLPASLIEVEQGCFSFNSIETLTIEDGTEPLPCDLGMYKIRPLEGNDNILTMNIGKNVSKEFFENACNKVKMLVIGDMVTTFEPTDFPALRTLEVGASLQSLPYLNTGDYLSNIKVKTAEPQNAGGFNKHTYLYATLHVPAGSKSAYENAEPWKNFKEIVEYEASGIDEIVENTTRDVYDLNGRLLFKKVLSTASLPKGIYIINHKKFVKQ